VTALILVTKIVRTAVEYISILGIHLNDQVSILALGAFANIMLMNLVVGHKITNFRFIGTDPKIQAVILVKLILKRESTDRTTQIKQVYRLHINFFGQWQLVILD
jgi:hypothetical protein